MAYVMDTDHLVILQRRTQPAFRNLLSRLRGKTSTDIFVSIISFHEEMQGWLALLNRARSAQQIVLAYRELEQLGRSFFEMNVLAFSEEAQRKFDELRQNRVRIGTMDLRIASIALVEGATVLTANTIDFQKVPGLAIEDWTQ
ncbi:MAG: type II toxin-antitoxin system VapC family toxin [Rhodopirellula sp.]|nr:type II toxin-antitoxin system VapC family toxin [Rhodopirellula sp.]